MNDRINHANLMRIKKPGEKRKLRIQKQQKSARISGVRFGLKARVVTEDKTRYDVVATPIRSKGA